MGSVKATRYERRWPDPPAAPLPAARPPLRSPDSTAIGSTHLRMHTSDAARQITVGAVPSETPYGSRGPRFNPVVPTNTGPLMWDGTPRQRAFSVSALGDKRPDMAWDTD